MKLGSWLIVGFLVGMLISGYVYACTTHTYIINGQLVTCQTCGNVTNCF